MQGKEGDSKGKGAGQGRGQQGSGRAKVEEGDSVVRSKPLWVFTHQNTFPCHLECLSYFA